MKSSHTPPRVDGGTYGCRENGVNTAKSSQKQQERSDAGVVYTVTHRKTRGVRADHATVGCRYSKLELTNTDQSQASAAVDGKECAELKAPGVERARVDEGVDRIREGRVRGDVFAKGGAGTIRRLGKSECRPPKVLSMIFEAYVT